MSKSNDGLATHVATELRGSARKLTEKWISLLSERLSVRTERLVPSEALLDHIPAVLEGIADFVNTPVETVKSSVGGRLRLLAQLRREQGYDISELLLEFEVLSHILTDAFVEIIDEHPDPDPVEVARLSGRIREGLAGISAATVSNYRQEEQEQQRELARKLSEFAQSIAHEMKTPLTAASAAVHMLMEDEMDNDPETQKRFTELVVRNLGRALDLLGDVRVLALSEGARAEERWMSINQVFKDVVDAFQETGEEQDVELLIDDDIPNIDVDAARVEIALANLISNAIKYSDPEKDRRWVKISARRNEDGMGPNSWRITVRDNGLGIPTEFQNNIFQRHFRAHPSAAEGSGLGLAIAANVVLQNGGSFSFDSTPGEGSAFHIDLPERRPQESQQSKVVP